MTMCAYFGFIVKDVSAFCFKTFCYKTGMVKPCLTCPTFICKIYGFPCKKHADNIQFMEQRKFYVSLQQVQPRVTT